MKYELSQLGADGFERLIQSLLAGETYGDGPDGQREVVIRNAKQLLALPGLTVSGYLMAQVKFKSPEGAAKDWEWLRTNLYNELEGFRKKAKNNAALEKAGKTDELYRLPDTWLLITNLILTPTLNNGLKDKADNYAKSYHDIIPRIVILGADDVKTMLDNRPMVASAFPMLINDGLQNHRALRTYAGLCFSDHANVDLKQAGDETGDPVDLRNVYTDLSVQVNDETISFSKMILEMSDKIFEVFESRGEQGKPLYSNSTFLVHAIRNSHIITRYVLLGEAGMGKSTVCRLLCQIFRAAILREGDDTSAEVQAYLESPKGTEELLAPRYNRIPIIVTLKDYAAWLQRRSVEASDLILYLLDKINERTNTNLGAPDFLELIRSEAWLFCFDGLDEVPITSNREQVIELITSFLDVLERYCCNHIAILTSRPQGYEELPFHKRFCQTSLLPMEPERCLSYLRRLLPYLERDPEEQLSKLNVMEAALRDSMTAKLMETPLYATILLILARSGGCLPSRRYDLFKEYCETVTRRERQKGLLFDLEGRFNWVQQIHREIGLKLQAESNTKENAAAELTLDRLHNIVSAYLERQGCEGNIDKLSASIEECMTHRLPFLAQTTNTDGLSCVLFPLRSIQEYYAAEGIIALPNHNRIGDEMKAISRSAYWRNVFLFAAGCFTGDLDRYSLLNDSLYNICCMDNGDPTQCPEEFAEYYGLTHLGSRLALDLLKEGIFTRSLDKKRYSMLLTPMLREPLNRSRVANNRIIRSMTEFPTEIKTTILDNVLVPLLRETLDGDSLGFLLLWELGCGENYIPKAAEALDMLASKVTVKSDKAIEFMLEHIINYTAISAVELLYRLTTENINFILYPHYSCLQEQIKLYNIISQMRKWTELPVSALRSLIYNRLSFGRGFPNVYWKGFSELEQELLGQTFSTVASLFTFKESNDSVALYYPIPERNEVPMELPQYLSALNAKGLPDIAALLDLQTNPGSVSLKRVIEIWGTLDSQNKRLFLRGLQRGSWYCEIVADSLYQGIYPDKIPTTRDEIVLQDSALRRWLEEPGASIRAKLWEDQIRFFIITPVPEDYCSKLAPEEALPVLRGLPLNRQHCVFLEMLTYNTKKLSLEVIDYLLERQLELVKSTTGGSLLLRLFAELPINAFRQGKFLWPTQITPIYTSVRMSQEQTFAAVNRIRNFTTIPETAVWEACAMIPYLISHVKNMSIVSIPKGQFGNICATNNQVACLGGIISLLTEPLDIADYDIITEKLKIFLSNATACSIIVSGCGLFCMENKLYLYKLAQDIHPEGEKHQNTLSQLMATCIEGIRTDLENASIG